MIFLSSPPIRQKFNSAQRRDLVFFIYRWDQYFLDSQFFHQQNLEAAF